jgi:hypothetical protein
MAWSNDNLEKFIELYRSYPCRWKVKSDEYKNRNLKNWAYDKLIEFCKSAVCSNANKDFVIKKIIYNAAHAIAQVRSFFLEDMLSTNINFVRCFETTCV